jgi:hypothetical protein
MGEIAYFGLNSAVFDKEISMIRFWPVIEGNR